MSTLQKIQKNLTADWVSTGTFSDSCPERLTWVFSPGHAGVKGIEHADCLAGDAIIDNDLTIDPKTVVQFVTQQLIDS